MGDRTQTYHQQWNVQLEATGHDALPQVPDVVPTAGEARMPQVTAGLPGRSLVEALTQRRHLERGEVRKRLRQRAIVRQFLYYFFSTCSIFRFI